MTQLDPSFGNLNQIRITNKLGALNSILSAPPTTDPGSPIIINNYGIKTYDDRFISISASSFDGLDDLSESYALVGQYLTNIIEGGACPNNNSEEVFEDDSGDTISASI